MYRKASVIFNLDDDKLHIANGYIDTLNIENNEYYKPPIYKFEIISDSVDKEKIEFDEDMMIKLSKYNNEIENEKLINKIKENKEANKNLSKSIKSNEKKLKELDKKMKEKIESKEYLKYERKSQIKMLEDFLKYKFPDGIIGYTTKNVIGDYMETIYQCENIIVDYAPSYEYIEIFGITETEYYILVNDGIIEGDL